MQHGGKLITDGQVRSFTRSILPRGITASGTRSIVMIGQKGLNLLVVCELATLIHGTVAKLSGCGGILGKPSIKTCKGWCLSICSKAP
jgi:hypothetical protein